MSIQIAVDIMCDINDIDGNISKYSFWMLNFPWKLWCP